MTDVINTDTPIHDWFGLTYAQYLAIPRSILQSMPIDWQEKFVACLEQLDEQFEWRRSGCWVTFKNAKGRYMTDRLCDYERGRRVMIKKEVRYLSQEHEREYKGTKKEKDYERS